MASSFRRHGTTSYLYLVPIPVVLNVDVSLALGELGAVRVHDEGEVRELRRVPPQGLIQQQVLWGRDLKRIRDRFTLLYGKTGYFPEINMIFLKKIHC